MRLHVAPEATSRFAAASQAQGDQEVALHLQRIVELEAKTRQLVDTLLGELHRIRADYPPQLSWRFRLRHWLKQLCGVRLGVLWQYDPLGISLPDHYSHEAPLANAPTISMVTPSFNQAAFLRQTLQSVLAQDYPRLEYIVQDGGSTDGSAAIVEEYRPRLSHAESKPDRGQAHALNLGFRRTSGEIMAYLNSDDLLLPGALHYVGKYFAEHPQIDVVYGHRILINDKGHEVGRWLLPAHNNAVLSWADYIPQETLFWRRRVWRESGETMDESFQFALDWDLLLRFREVGAKFARLPRFLGAFRLHAVQKTMQQLAGIGAQEMDRLRWRCHGREVTPREIQENLRGYLLRHAVLQTLHRWGLIRH